MKTEAWAGVDDVETIAEWLLELARENKKGNIAIVPQRQEELGLLVDLAKRVIVNCIEISKRGDK